MVTVSTLLSKPIFSTFRLLSGKGGLDNTVSVSGFFEWEDEAHIRKDFIPGIFVLTTLSMFRDNWPEAEKHLKLLIRNGVSAIAIKNVFFDGVSDSLRGYADQFDVPLFIFSDTYVNDIIQVIQNEVADSAHHSLGSTVLETIIKGHTLSAASKQDLLCKINPYFHLGSMASIYISDGESRPSSSQKSLRLYQYSVNHIKQLIKELEPTAEVTYSYTLYKRGVFFLLTHEDKGCDTFRQYLRALKKQLCDAPLLQGFYIGTSAVLPSADISRILKEAIFANTSCILDQCRYKNITDIGLDYAIFDHIESETSNACLDHFMEMIAEAESNHTPFLDTLLVYTQCDGNIERTAEILHQHKNTIRYRLERIRKLFDARDDISFVGSLFYFVRAYRAKPYLRGLLS